MKNRRNLQLIVAAAIIGFVVVSGIPPSTGAPIARLQAVFTPAVVAAQSLVEGKGKVIAVTQEKQEVVLEHGEIKGFMEAMTMGYKVSSPALLKNLRPGDQVQFTIDKSKSLITKISKLKN